MLKLRGMYNQFVEVKRCVVLRAKRIALKGKTVWRRRQKDRNPRTIDPENEPNQWKQSNPDSALVEHREGPRVILRKLPPIISCLHQRKLANGHQFQNPSQLSSLWEANSPSRKLGFARKSQLFSIQTAEILWWPRRTYI